MMYKKIPLLFSLTLLMGCPSGNSGVGATDLESQKTKNKVITLSGSFIHLNDYAVLQTPTEIYGVILDSTALLLSKQVQPLKKEETDMISVVLKAKLSNKKDRTSWEKKVEITEIVTIIKPISNNPSSTNED